KFRIADDAGIYPVVGDDVDLIVADDGCWIDKIHHRRSKISRQEVDSNGRKEQVIIANLQICVIVTSVNEPPFKPRLVDRTLVSALKGGLKPIIVLNKCDLNMEFKLRFWKELYEGIGYTFIPTSAVTGEGVIALKNLLVHNISVFIGQSGVGKSSLLNRIHPGLEIAAKQVSQATSKGRHTTTRVTMHPIEHDGFVVDTPGLRELGLWDVNKSELGWFYEEFRSFIAECKFRDCLHISEPGCAVRNAVTQNKISEVRFESYSRILESIKETEF
ncbi:ribosome small subunit-dependent GTPase A, partial [bacterium (Candidatus Howlettbacteria) CG_4_10_14_0_8_um_filter_40_9]